MGGDLLADETRKKGAHSAFEFQNTAITNITIPKGAITPASNKQPFIFVIPETGFGQWHPLRDKEVTIGRSRDNTIQIDSVNISRTHVRILTLGPDNFVLEDMDSTNGTYVNGQKIKTHQLHSGDKISLSDSIILMFELKDKDDITVYENLYRSATRDALTGIYNRHYFLEIASKELAFATRHFSIFSLIFFDIDNFKSLNDQHGHPFGDTVLKSITETVSHYIRSSDIFARLGGEEFIILLRNILPSEATFLAEKIRNVIENIPFQTPAANALKVTTSLGVISFDPEQHQSLDQMLDNVDKRLYKAKEKGRNVTIIDDQGRKESRRYPRYPFSTNVRIPGSTHDYTFETLDISFGGVKLRTSSDLIRDFSWGMDVRVVFSDEFLKLDCLGKVVRITEDEQGFRYLGIRFESLTKDQLETIKKGIQKIKHASYKSLFNR